MIDRTTPSGGSVSYLDGYDTTGSLTITTADGTDTGTGLDTGSGLIQRDVTSLTGGACGSFTDSWSTVSSPDSVASGSCYRYRYRIADLAGNVATYTSGSVAKVDTSAPSAPSFSFSALTNAVASGQTVYFRSGAAGGFTVTAASSDAQSGIDSYAFPALGTGWSGTPSGDSTDYSFGSSAADPVEPIERDGQNNAGLDSTPTSFTVSADGSAPVSSIACDGAACTGGWYTSTVSVTLSASDGAGAGLQEIRYTTDGSDPSPINGTIYAGAFDLSATTTVKFRAYDLLGNEEAVGSQLVQIDSSAPPAPALSFGSFQNAVLTGGVVWYRPSAASGQFAVTASSSDGESGIAGYTFPAAAPAGRARSAARRPRTTIPAHRPTQRSRTTSPPRTTRASHRRPPASRPIRTAPRRRARSPATAPPVRAAGTRARSRSRSRRAMRPRASRRSATRPTAPIRPRATAPSTRAPSTFRPRRRFATEPMTGSATRKRSASSSFGSTRARRPRRRSRSARAPPARSSTSRERRSSTTRRAATPAASRSTRRRATQARASTASASRRSPG